MTLTTKRVLDIARSVKILGFTDAARYISLRLQPERYAGETIFFKPRNSLHKLACRSGTSDAMVFKQVFIDAEYSPLLGLTDVSTVLDLGANVGYSAAWFLSAFPGCRVIALEPARGNYELLRENLAPFGNRATCDLAAVWSETTFLKLQRREALGGHEWAWQVRSSSMTNTSDGERVRAFSMPDLLSRFHIDRVSILKMDIEGAETIIFSAPSVCNWLSRVDAIAIELHDNLGFGSATQSFFGAVAGEPLSCLRSGELIICRRQSG